MDADIEQLSLDGLPEDPFINLFDGRHSAVGRKRHLGRRVSMQISSLEESLGGKLFRRVGRNLELTDLGHVVFRYADEIFAFGLELLDTVKGRSIAGPLRFEVGIVDILPKLMARKILEPALALPERLRLVCHEGKEKQLLAELAIHSLDIVLTDTPVKSGLSIKAYSHLLGECGVTFCAVESLAGPLRAGFPQSLNNARMLLPTPMSALRGSLDQWFGGLGVRPEIAGEFDDHALLKVFGQAGDGVFTVPSIHPRKINPRRRQLEKSWAPDGSRLPGSNLKKVGAYFSH